VGIVSVSGLALAATAYQPASGRPWNNDAVSNFNVSDGIVCFNSGRSWIVPLPIPVSGSNVTHAFSGDYGNMGDVQAWSFNKNGTAFSGVSFSNFNASVVVPPSGTAFVKGIATSSTSLQACLRQVAFVN
jgi:hypothetical protein